MFGGINSIFTALILAGSFYTIYLQHTEIKNFEQQSEETKNKDYAQIRLLAYTALIDAKTATLNTRQRLIEQSMKTTDESNDSMFMAALKMQQATEASNDFNEINRLSKEIEKILKMYENRSVN